MEKFDELKYKGFDTVFYVSEKVKSFLEQNNIDLDKIKEKYDKDNKDYSFFYEVLLFESLDEDSDGKPDIKFGKEFKAIFYRAAKLKKDYNDDLEKEIIVSVMDNDAFESGESIYSGSKSIDLDENNLIEVEYKVIRNS